MASKYDITQVNVFVRLAGQTFHFMALTIKKHFIKQNLYNNYKQCIIVNVFNYSNIFIIGHEDKTEVFFLDCFSTRNIKHFNFTRFVFPKLGTINAKTINRY